MSPTSKPSARRDPREPLGDGAQAHPDRAREDGPSLRRSASPTPPRQRSDTGARRRERIG